ncbi:hypothetical protein HEK616_46780 [Streptomyces nigrescens]|uniref:Uncharacterized protein n=2 Tax=Streptomyces TaxID=1883 RepID=A0ABM7ZXV6_STRNI|nr:hypothetical protein [Streptomyces nigrescens]MEE4424184.1 hypothetical protein [Streptomyces sp. DSM 41528]BDM71191.1 hypothetical protein HEK616_46780 [Streptomyces nigrescens]
MSERQSSPHERLLTYLREGDRLVPPDTRTVHDWDLRYGSLAAAADLRGATEPPGPADLSPASWYDDGREAGLGRPAASR